MGDGLATLFLAGAGFVGVTTGGGAGDCDFFDTVGAASSADARTNCVSRNGAVS